jgi:hypothetical protein
MRGLGNHWSASLLIRSHPVRSFWLRLVSVRIQSTMMWVPERRQGIDVGWPTYRFMIRSHQGRGG